MRNQTFPLTSMKGDRLLRPLSMSPRVRGRKSAGERAFCRSACDQDDPWDRSRQETARGLRSGRRNPLPHQVFLIIAWFSMLV